MFTNLINLNPQQDRNNLSYHLADSIQTVQKILDGVTLKNIKF